MLLNNSDYARELYTYNCAESRTTDQTFVRQVIRHKTSQETKRLVRETAIQNFKRQYIPTDTPSTISMKIETVVIQVEYQTIKVYTSYITDNYMHLYAHTIMR